MMILDFVVILLTKHIPEQIGFYKDMLELELLFENQNNYGFGKDKRLFIILKKDTSEDSHHLTEQKGPQIISFKCNGNINQYMNKIQAAGFKVRDTLKLPEYNAHYLFIEDFDGNEICLDFTI